MTIARTTSTGNRSLAEPGTERSALHQIVTTSCSGKQKTPG